ncbi:MAG: hypothetical protein FWD75_05775 [Propionibacteriaceae bacterium]|nr:hypothetical protein [Propionibacteriaceae bacterium]
MTGTTAPRRAITKRRWTAPFAILLTAFTLLTGSLTYAMWTSQSTIGATVAAGDFEIGLGQMSVTCADSKGGAQACSLDDLVLSPGQELTIRQEVTSSFVGDNLAVEFSVAFASMPDGFLAQWHVEKVVDGAPAQVAPEKGDVKITTALLLPDTHDSTDQKWVVVISLVHYSPEAGPQWVDPTATPAPQTVSLGALTVTANQVRCGTGFSVACPTGEPEVTDE